MKYVCLLRGLNVGGKNKVSMTDLRLVFEKLGFDNVVTYINSGNVLFSSSEEPSTINLEQSLESAFGFSMSTLILNEDRIKAIAEAIPNDWQNDLTQKSDVVYLLPDVDVPEIIKELNYKPEIETVLYAPGALLCNISRKNQSRGSLLKLMGKPLYQRLTIRNVNTARKLRDLCS